MAARAAGWAGALMGAAAILAGSPGWADPIRPGESRGLGLIGPDVPPILKQAQADPYAPPAEPACASVPQELAALDELLGPDMGGEAKRNQASELVGRTIRHAIPYRGWVRFLTGAERKEKALARAAMAGWARRGFLKGVARSLDCGERRVASVEPAPAAPAAAEAGELQPTAATVAEAPAALTAQSVEIATPALPR